MASLMTDGQREAFVRRVRLEMAKAGLTREALAERAACKERTLGNLLAGQPVRDQTVAKIARVLAIDLEDVIGRGGPEPAGAGAHHGEGRAGEEYGGYMLSAYAHYLGTYIAYRRVFSDKNELFRSVYEIDWDDEQRRLRFFELQRFRGANDRPVSSSHAGGIYISPHTNTMHLLTTFQGAIRLVTLGKPGIGDNRLRGVILTQSDRGVFFQPAISAIFLERLEVRRKNSELEKLIGAFGATDPSFRMASEELADIEANKVYFAGMTRPGKKAD